VVDMCGSDCNAFGFRRTVKEGYVLSDTKRPASAKLEISRKCVRGRACRRLNLA
jgi:hypothetical protein